MIKREITKEIKILAKEFPVVAILGPRQSGKTTIAKYIFKKYKYVSLEDHDMRELIINDPRGFLSQYNENVIIDEVQRAPNFFSYLQTHVDNMNKNGSFILTGSHNYLLMENISQSLAGRVGLSTLLPLSLEELPSKNKKNISKLLFNGFYPRIFDQNIRASSFYKTYLNTYLERDIRLIKNITNYDLFLKFLKLIAGRCGQILNVKTIGEDLGMSSKTVESWLSILETSYIIYHLQPYHKNYNKRIIKHPKLFFYDTGLVCHLLGIRKYQEVDTHYLRGALFENFIISDLIKYDYNLGSLSSFYFWKDNHDNEIDLIIESGNKVSAIEIKLSETIKKEFFKNLNNFDKLEKAKIKKMFLIYGGTQELKNNEVYVTSWGSLSTVKKLNIF